MHEMSLLNDLLARIEQIARQNDAERVTRVMVRIGAYAHISADHFREHFVDGTRGTRVQDAELEVIMDPDTESSTADRIELVEIDVE